MTLPAKATGFLLDPSLLVLMLINHARDTLLLLVLLPIMSRYTANVVFVLVLRRVGSLGVL